MLDYLGTILDPSGFTPRRLCGNWTAGLVLLHTASDAMTFASYTAISALLVHFIRRRLDAPFRPLFWLFGAFIFACGLTHLLEVVVFYRPIYRLIGAVKLATGLVSLVTVGALVRVVPRALALRGLRIMELEIEERRQAEAAAEVRTRQLEALVELGRRALATSCPDAMAGEVASLAALGLGVDLCGVFQPSPGRPELRLEAGVGWRAGRVGSATVPGGTRSLVGSASRRSGTVLSPDLAVDGRFDPAPLEREHGVTGGLGVEVHNPQGSHGVLVAYTTRPAPGGPAPRRPFGDDDLRFLRSVVAVFESNLRRIEAERVLRTLATTDALTGLHNARHLREESRAIEKRAARDGRTLSAVMVDVDHFKGYNDAFGHPAGDEVLREVGVILRREARAGDLVARYGGEEFAILLPGAGAAEAWEFAERLRLAISAHPWPLRPVTASLGVATATPPEMGAVALLSRADQALYAAKRAGRDRVAHGDLPGPAGEPAGPVGPRAEGPARAGPRVLHVDDDPAYRRELGRHLSRAGFRVRGAETWAEGLTRALEGPDLILLDVRLPDGDGLDLCRRLKVDSVTAAIPILTLSGTLESGADRAAALASGASAALLKSGDPEELLAVASALVRSSRGHRNLGRSIRKMGERLGDQAAKMERFCDATIEGWARMLELRDHETEGHSRRVTELTTRLARKMGLDDGALVDVRRGALLHDIGKIGVPDAILRKAGPLDEAEWRVMRLHPGLARQMLEPIHFLKTALAIPGGHHERWDGTGYPDGLKGEQIPISARIFAAADIYDALSHDRPYRPAWPAGRVVDHIRGLAGTHLDPDVVVALLDILASSRDEPPDVEPAEPVPSPGPEPSGGGTLGSNRPDGGAIGG